MTSTRRRGASQELNREAEDPNLWNDQQRAQRVMQERTALEDQLTSIGRIERELDDQLTMIELGEAEKDQAVVSDAEAALKKLKTDVGAARAGGAAVGRGRLQRQLSRSPCRRRRHREPGLGQHAAAHVHALGRAARLQGRVPRGDRRRRSRDQVGDHRDQGPQRLWLAQDRGRRAPPGAHLAVRFQRAAAHVVCQRDRLSGDRRPHQGRHQGIRRACRHDARPGRRRPARQQDRVRDPADPYPDRASWSSASRTARSTATARRHGRCCARDSTKRN